MIHIDSEKCKACGICAHVCPRHVTETIEREGEKSPLSLQNVWILAWDVANVQQFARMVRYRWMG